MSFHLFIHSFRPFLYRLFKSSTTQRRSRIQHGYFIGVSRRSAQAIVCKGFAQGPYVTARAGVEPTTLRLKVIVSTNVPPRPMTSAGKMLHTGNFLRTKTLKNYRELKNIDCLPVCLIALSVFCLIFCLPVLGRSSKPWTKLKFSRRIMAPLHFVKLHITMISAKFDRNFTKFRGCSAKPFF